MIEQLPEFCALALWPCWTRAEWISLWGGVIGAAAAFVLAIWYEAWLRGRRERQARGSVAQAVRNLQAALTPFFDESHAIAPSPADEIVSARVALGWAKAHAEFFTFDDWRRLQELAEALDVWVRKNLRLGGFEAALHDGQLENRQSRDLARSTAIHFAALPAEFRLP